MGLLFIGFAVGLVVAFLLRTLLQYERDGLARVGDGLLAVETALAELDERVRNLEAIAASEADPMADAPATSESRHRRERA